MKKFTLCSLALLTAVYATALEQLSQPVLKSQPLQEWAAAEGIVAEGRSVIYMLTLEDDSLAVFKPEDVLYQSLGEVVTFNAARWLGLDLIPPVVIRNDVMIGEQPVQGSLMRFKRPSTRLHTTAELRNAISCKQFAEQQIFSFVLGRYDMHFGNYVIYQEGDCAKVALIDNGCILARQYVAGYGELPWVAMRKAAMREGEAATLAESLQKPQQPEEILAEFPDFDFYTNRSINQGFTHIWGGYLWRQFYGDCRSYLEPSFSNVIPAGLLARLQELDADVLRSFFPALPVGWDDARLAVWVEGVLQRRDMVVAYFAQNPAGVV